MTYCSVRNRARLASIHDTVLRSPLAQVDGRLPAQQLRGQRVAADQALDLARRRAHPLGIGLDVERPADYVAHQLDEVPIDTSWSVATWIVRPIAASVVPAATKPEAVSST